MAPSLRDDTSHVRMMGKQALQPYLRVFPIWRYGSLYDRIDGHYVGEGWYPDRFGARVIATTQTRGVG